MRFNMQRFNIVVGTRNVRATGDFDVPTLMLTTLLHRRPRRRIHGFYWEGGGYIPVETIPCCCSWSYIFMIRILKYTVFKSRVLQK